jgi:hypothetical protein
MLPSRPFGSGQVQRQRTSASQSAVSAQHRSRRQQQPAPAVVLCRAAADPQQQAAAPEARKAGRMTYKPASYGELVQDATNSVLAALADGITLMEVEFPALPTNVDGAAAW